MLRFLLALVGFALDEDSYIQHNLLPSVWFGERRTKGSISELFSGHDRRYVVSPH